MLIESRQRITRLPPEQFIDRQFDYPYTLERAIHATTLLYRGSPAPAQNDRIPSLTLRLDPEQERAVLAHDGVVQVIAPAGSGKTAVLIERVRELLRRGAGPERILCTTFNRDTTAVGRSRPGTPISRNTARIHSYPSNRFAGAPRVFRKPADSSNAARIPRASCLAVAPDRGRNAPGEQRCWPDVSAET